MICSSVNVSTPWKNRYTDDAVRKRHWATEPEICKSVLLTFKHQLEPRLWQALFPR
jgi:hypothetical protein